MHIGYQCGKARRKETTRKTKRMWVDNIKMDLRAIGWGGMDWIDLAQDRDQRKALVNMAIKFWVPKNVGKFLIS
jgi:hypothetical protein